MASKVFLFGSGHWLYCSDVTFKDGIYRGWVVNGAWKMTADTAKDTLSSVNGSYANKLSWACDPNVTGWGYNEVINDAEQRYEGGELPNFTLKEPESTKLTVAEIKRGVATTPYGLEGETHE